MNTLWTIVSVLIMTAGLIGTVVPFVPGIVLIYAGYLFYGFVTGWHAYGAGTVVVWGVVAGLLMLLDFYAGSIGAKKFGASRFGIWGSFIGAVVGALAAGLPGLILGPFVGALAGELIGGRSSRQALRSAWGSFIGLMTGSLVRIAVGVVMVGTFLWLVLS
jgi:hypothetical protein